MTMENPYSLEIEKVLGEGNMPYQRMEHDPVFSMGSYQEIEQELDCKVPKNLFLSNQQHTKFYLLLMPGEKKFKTKELSQQIHSARLSFAKEEELEDDLHCFHGCTNPFSLLFDKDNKISLLIDEDLLSLPRLGFHPCLNTVTLGIRTEDFLSRFLKRVHHPYTQVQLKGE